MVKLGYDMGYSGGTMDLPFADAIYAEELGFDSIWASESYGSDAFVPLAYLAGLTRKIRLGTGVAQLAARSPANFAMVVQTIEAIAGEGRMAPGLGVSGPQIVEGWYGEPWGRPAARLRDYVAIVKQIWRREGPVVHKGREISLPYDGPGAIGLGKPVKSILHGNPDIPIALGTSKPANTRLAGEIADGWHAMHVVPETLPAYVKLLKEGMDKRSDGKTFRDFELFVNLGVTLTDDVRAAIDAAKPGLALYVGGMGAKSANFHKDAMIERGYGEAAERVQTLYLAGHKAEAAEAIPDEFFDESMLIGNEARIRERWPRWRDSGFTTFRLHRAPREVMALMARLVQA